MREMGLFPRTTRVAPSPTGSLHLGTARTAYINWLAAKASNGKFILRIDDTDVERNKEEYTKVIFDSLEWLGLDYDAVYYQSKNINIYKLRAQELLNAGQAKELDNGAIALCLPENMPETFKDTISGDIPITETNKQQIHEKVILLRGYSLSKIRTCTKAHDRCEGVEGHCPYCEYEVDKSKYGQPTYQFCSAVDDYELGINWIIRGSDHITNTPKQIAIWYALIDAPFDHEWIYKLQFTHMGLIFNNKKKLSKRDGAASLLWYKEQGYSPAAVLNFMLRLGWAPKGDGKEHQFIDKNRALELFFQGNLSNRPCNYDLAKLDSLQRHYV